MNRLRPLLILLVAALFLLGCHRDKLVYYTSPNPYEVVKVDAPCDTNSVRNVILMIGDGMGLEQVSCAWVLNHGKLNFDNASVVGLSRTWSTSDLITDSGAGGTALAAGKKTANDHVGLSASGEPLYSFLSKAHGAGMKTGVVTVCHLADATPADFCSHNEYRYNFDDIIADYLTCDVDYIAGGGRDFFAKKRKDGRDIAAEMAEKGYHVVRDEAALLQAELPVLGLLSDDNLPVAGERGDLFRHMVTKGLDGLSAAAGDKGFAMMIEGSCIDDWLHGNRIDLAMEELLDFDRTIGDVLQWAEKDGHTLVVITADHATGSLTLQDGNLEEGRIGVAFGSEGHNGIAVPYYVWGAGASAFGGILENDELGRRIASFIP